MLPEYGDHRASELLVVGLPGGATPRPERARPELGTGIAAAAAVHAILADDGATEVTIDYYAAYQRHAVQSHAASAAAVYSDHRTNRDQPFWRLRSSAPPERPLTVPTVLPGELLARPVRLATGATLSSRRASSATACSGAAP